MNKLRLFIMAASFSAIISSCSDDKETPQRSEDPSTFEEISSLPLPGGEGAAEISAYDANNQRLFVVNNAEDSRIDVVDFSDPENPAYIESIDVTSYGDGVNSVAVYGDLLAAAIEADEKTDNGKVVVFNTEDYSLVKQITVGALPDMVTFSPNGNYILSANEGEPNDDYSIDPEGSISIIDVNNDYSVLTLGFASFESQLSTLMNAGLRVFGPAASLAQDIEPEYIAVSEDSRTAWATLQENNAVARIDLTSKTITDIFPLGFKDYSISGNGIDASDEDGKVEFTEYKVWGMYLPDAIASFRSGGMDYFVTANEGDAREYDTFEEEERIEDIELNESIFPNGDALKAEDVLGRLKITSTLGDPEKDGIYDELYSFGARSFSIWNGATGELVYDSGNDIEKRINDAGLYDDGRSDDKGVEPEGVTLGTVNGKLIAFVGLERVDAVVMYDISNPTSAQFIKILETGDAPEGLVFIPFNESPNGGSLLVVSSEDDGVIKTYQPDEAL